MDICGYVLQLCHSSKKLEMTVYTEVDKLPYIAMMEYCTAVNSMHIHQHGQFSRAQC